MTECTISISELGFIPPLVRDYLSGNRDLEFLYQFPPNEQGLIQSILSKTKNFHHREVFSKVVSTNYPDQKELTAKESENIRKLLENGLVVTTAHQPNLFLGPMYVFTKAVSTISLANHLNGIQSECHIVPVFIIGSEDHDKEELLHMEVFGNRYEWNTHQKGAVGSMLVDESLIELLDKILVKFGDSVEAKYLKEVFRTSYQIGKTLAQAFGDMLRQLFGKHGLMVLDINIPEVKEAMQGVFLKELESQFSKKQTASTIDFLAKNYHVQAPPTDINLFEYREGERIKIKSPSEETIQRLRQSPTSYSPSVILRPLMQQIVVPSIANIGGAAEVAYWLELKPIFEEEKVDFPVILLRDIYSILDEKSWKKWKEASLDERDFFISIDEFKRKIATSNYDLEADQKEDLEEVEKLFESVKIKIKQIDASLEGTAIAESVKTRKAIEMLYGKAIKSLKNREESKIQSLEKIRNKVFEDNTLKERRENFASYYLQYGESWIENCISHLSPLDNLWRLDIL